MTHALTGTEPASDTPAPTASPTLTKVITEVFAEILTSPLHVARGELVAITASVERDGQILAHLTRRTGNPAQLTVLLEVSIPAATTPPGQAPDHVACPHADSHRQQPSPEKELHS